MDCLDACCEHPRKMENGSDQLQSDVNYVDFFFLKKNST